MLHHIQVTFTSALPYLHYVTFYINLTADHFSERLETVFSFKNSLMRIRNLCDPGSGIGDPGWKNLDPGSGINIPDPQHCSHLYS
jgi:hypothetical protein